MAVDLKEALKELLAARRVLQGTMKSFGMTKNPGVVEVQAHLDVAVLDLRKAIYES